MLIRTALNPCVNPHLRTLTSLAQEGGRGLVLKSLSTDVYENLALEDWIHDHVDLQSRTLLLLWKNTPAVVIGRHQNPWQECNLRLMRDRGVALARRRSGGGTVYHDLGNINMTFFTSRKKYDRVRNLRVVTSALQQLRPGLDVRATERFDILLNGGYKISGTAAKLGRVSAYHHCTLLCGSDRSLLSAVLRSSCQGIQSNATPSVPSPVKNLQDEDPSLDCRAVMDAVAAEYSAQYGLDHRVSDIDPTDEISLPGIRRMAQDLKTWEWVYGKTPKFSVRSGFEVRDGSSSSSAALRMGVRNGLIESCRVELPADWLPAALCDELAAQLIGGRFCPGETAVLTAAVLRTCPQGSEIRNKWNILCDSVAAVM
ncbi:lipoyl amidotransferase LIPT1, mitochondrial [Amia ocellicauda]|uniref:lipoyl amidotransferase LIPT1, mitochondrial n=1 Tax=Amia ocellicauda TaxID=2972642 RepID=UPI003464550F